jgi:SAM-dependent methyltransferase
VSANPQQSPLDPQEFKTAQKAGWATAADGWRKWRHRFEPATADLNRKLVEIAGVRPGHRVLDVASGIGDPALEVARTTGAKGSVVATDFSPEMLAVARERAQAEGLGNLETRIADAEKLDLPAASFDAATCRWCVMLVLDPAAVCKGVRRALKPDARFATAVWSEPEKVPFLAIPAMVAMREAGLPPPAPGTPGPLSMGKPGIVEAVLSAAGFRDVKVETVNVIFDYASPAEYADTLDDMSASLRRALEGKPADVRAKVRAEIERAIGAFRTPDGRVRIVNEVRCASGKA